jgi:hypothetical protein
LFCRAAFIQEPDSRANAGALEPGTRIAGLKLVLAPSDVQRSDLEQFLEAQRDPSSPDYQNWLTPEQYGERFGLSGELNRFAVFRAEQLQ